MYISISDRLRTVLAAQDSIISNKYEVEQSLRMQGACREWADQWPIMHADYQQTPLVLWQSLSVEHVPWTIKGMTQSACSTRKAGGICPGLPRCSVGIASVRETLKIIYEKSNPRSSKQRGRWASLGALW